ncbi:hypothetical protein [Nonomuraea sp. NPDC002799]
MIGDLGAGDFDRLIEAARLAVESAGTPAPDPPEVRHKSADPDGLVSVTAVLTATGARLGSLELNARARRMDSRDLAELVLRTVNEALDGLVVSAHAESAPDLAELSAELRALQDFSAENFGIFADTINDVLRRFERQTEG